MIRLINMKKSIQYIEHIIKLLNKAKLDTKDTAVELLMQDHKNVKHIYHVTYQLDKLGLLTQDNYNKIVQNAAHASYIKDILIELSRNRFSCTQDHYNTVIKYKDFSKKMLQELRRTGNMNQNTFDGVINKIENSRFAFFKATYNPLEGVRNENINDAFRKARL